MATAAELSTPAEATDEGVSTRSCAPARSRFAVFSECPHCGGDMAPEHAHYRCTMCGWRDSCCD